jgi:hypothetical protein
MKIEADSLKLLFGIYSITIMLVEISWSLYETIKNNLEADLLEAKLNKLKADSKKRSQ